VRREVDPVSASSGGDEDTQEVLLGLSVDATDTAGGGSDTIDDAELEALFGDTSDPAAGLVSDAPDRSPYPDSPRAESPYPDAVPVTGAPSSAVTDALPVRPAPAVPAPAPARVPAVGAVEGDVMVLAEPASGALVAPRKIGALERRRRVKLQARRVRRIVRHVEPWSVMKMSIIFYACLWVILLVAGVVVWSVADSAGVIDSLETQIKDYFVLDTFELNANEVLRGYAFGGAAFAIAGTAFNVLMCLLFNLISDLVGGLRVTMIEEETARPRPVRRVRRPRPTR
jgi:hypothetical protein